MLLDIVHAQHRSAALVRGKTGGDARSERPRRGSGIACELAERALARDADEYRAPERDERVEAAKELDVVRHRLAEPDPRIEADALLGNPARDGERDPVLQEPRHFGDNIVLTLLHL